MFDKANIMRIKVMNQQQIDDEDRKIQAHRYRNTIKKSYRLYVGNLVTVREFTKRVTLNYF